MDQDLKKLKNEFLKIRDRGLIKSLRSGTTGVGYTFESLLDKEEDWESKPDFGSIEIKCKLGYSKSDLTLFNCVPERKNCKETATQYVFNRYKYPRSSKEDDFELFSRQVFSNYSKEVNGYEFKIKVDYLIGRVIIQSFYHGEFLEDVCYWEFETLKKKLVGKIKNLALVYAYPYRKNGEIYYKYLKMEIYQLRSFYDFLELLVTDKISINFYLRDLIKETGEKVMDNHGISFKIKKDYITKLYKKICTF